MIADPRLDADGSEELPQVLEFMRGQTMGLLQTGDRRHVVGAPPDCEKLCIYESPLGNCWLTYLLEVTGAAAAVCSPEPGGQSAPLIMITPAWAVGIAIEAASFGVLLGRSETGNLLGLGVRRFKTPAAVAAGILALTGQLGGPVKTRLRFPIKLVNLSEFPADVMEDFKL